eukprot:scaffold9935_cov28-Attheya_sp.AAC.1
MDRASETGAWLTVMPDRLNGTDLSADEFRDSLLLRFGLTPLFPTDVKAASSASSRWSTP